MGVAASSAVAGSRDALTTVGEISQSALSSTGEALEAVGHTAIRAKALASEAARGLEPPSGESASAAAKGASPKVYAPAP